MTQQVVRFDRVTLRRGARRVLSDVSFALDRAEFIGLLGPNGAGKTSLLRAILGLLAPSNGRIDVFGAPARRGQSGIGYMPQSRAGAASAQLRGWDFVASACGGARYGLPLLSRGEKHAVAQAIDHVNAAELATRSVATLSGGERQRLLLAQALLAAPSDPTPRDAAPRLLLLDEPLAGLDPPAQSEIVALVDRLRLTLGCTVLFSAHELNPLLPAMDRVLYLARGEAAIGTAAEVITTQVLSRLYGAPVEVARIGGRVFVLPADAASPPRAA